MVGVDISNMIQYNVSYSNLDIGTESLFLLPALQHNLAILNISRPGAIQLALTYSYHMGDRVFWSSTGHSKTSFLQNQQITRLVFLQKMTSRFLANFLDQLSNGFVP